MIPIKKYALGIAIADNRINIAVMSKSKDSVELITTINTPMPSGMIENGNLKDAAGFTQFLKELKKVHKIKSGKTAISVACNNVLMQLMYMPKPIPMNVKKFFEGEIKQYAALTADKIALDFCGINSLSNTKDKRLLVAAADYEKVVAVSKACIKAGFDVQISEPLSIAAIRSFYAKKIGSVIDSNVLMAILENHTLTIFVFRDKTLDFVSTKSLNKELSVSEGINSWINKQLNAVIQFYDVEVADSCKKWHITIFDNDGCLPEDCEAGIKADIEAESLEIKNYGNSYGDMEFCSRGDANIASPVATGLASRIFKFGENELVINLLPPEISELSAIKKDLLIISNAAAIVFFIMMLLVGYLAIAVKNPHQSSSSENISNLPSQTRNLLEDQKLVNMQIEALAERVNSINSVFSSHSTVYWNNILQDIKNSTPVDVCITKLSCGIDASLSLQGMAASYDSVKLFIESLNKSAAINHASLAGTTVEDDAQGMVKYAVNCSLALQEGEK